MGRLQRLFNWFSSDIPRINEKDALALRLEFQSRYHQFKLLLNANNQALEIMSEVEKALEGTFPFGMKFIRSRTMGVYTRVFQIVKHMDALAPGKYKVLSSRLESIRLSLESLVNPDRSAVADENFILHVSALDKSHADQAGMKMANLGEMANRLHLKVPDGFVVTASAFRHFLDHNDLKVEIQRRIQSAEEEGHHRLYTISADIRQLIQNTPLPSDLEAAIMGAYSELAARQHQEINLAVRSSALNEDREGTSFAGLYHSALNISKDHLVETYKQIVAAAYSPAVMAYRFNRGISEEETEMCVGVIQMVDAVCGGVLYSANPMNIRDRSVTINSTWGLPKAVVDGTTATDLFRVTKSPTLAVTHRANRRSKKKNMSVIHRKGCADWTTPDRKGCRPHSPTVRRLIWPPWPLKSKITTAAPRTSNGPSMVPAKSFFCNAAPCRSPSIPRSVYR